MKQKDREILKKTFSQISKLTYSELKYQFNKEYEEKLKIDTKYSHDLNVEGRLEREEYITNLDASQLKSFKSVVKAIQDNYLFTEDDIDRLNNFTSRLNYLLKSTSPHNRGMADQMNNIKHGARVNPNSPTVTLKSNSNELTNSTTKSAELEIHKFFNDCVKSNTWADFKSNSELDSSFFDKSFEWKLVYVFSNIKNCQNKTSYPLYYPAWQITAEWCFDVEYGNYDAFCNYYRNIDFLDEPKLLHFSCYYYLLRLALRNNKSYKELIDSKEEKEKQKIIKELREDEDDELSAKVETNENNNEMASNNKYYLLAINQLSRIFSIAQAGKEFDFTLSTSESSLSDSTISENDILLVSIDDKVYYQFKVIDKTEEEIRLKKVFEIEKTIGYTIDEEGVVIEINKKDFDSICSQLFDHLVHKDDSSVEIPIDPTIYVKEKYTGRFVFQVLTYLDELDKLDRIKPFFKVNSEPIYTSIKTDEVSLTSVFKTSENKLSKEELTFNDGKPRFFEDVIFNWEDKNYYLSTEWTSGKNRRLDLDNFKTIIEKYYPDYIIYENNGYYFFADNIPAKRKRDQVKFNISSFHDSCKNSGLIFSLPLIQRFVASLCTKPFVICSGLSGSGKTKLAQAFAQWICYKEEDGEKNEQYCIVPVGADWTNREPLLGYPNALNKEEYVSPENGVLDLMIRAKQNVENQDEPTKPYFLILDEMNLSHVERYFADFLSTMESGDSIPLHKIQPEPTKDLITVPQTLKLPKNLFIIGTVNIDETTYMFSPKVLDRANTIEFRLTEKDLADFIASDIKLDMDLLKAKGANMSDSFMAMALKETVKNLKPSEADLKLFFSELKKSGAEFGYRTASEIGRLMYMLEELGESGDNLLDIAIMQKLLPKLHGSRSKLNTALTTLAKFCVNDAVKDFDGKDEDFRKTYFIPFDKLPTVSLDKIKYKISFEKISRMHKNAMENGFTSYAEA